MLKILVVEDDRVSLALIEEVFSSLGARVRTTSDSRVASEWIDREKFDGIVLDLLMPKMDGFELTAAIRRSTWNLKTPVIVVSGHDDRMVAQRAFAAGASFFLPKPVDREKLTRLYKIVAGTLMKEQRRFRRIPFTTEVTCDIGLRTLVGTSIDISEGGILFRADDSPTTGQSVRLSFRLRGQSRPVIAESMVVRVEESHRAACYFTKINAKDLQALQKFVERSR